MTRSDIMVLHAIAALKNFRVLSIPLQNDGHPNGYRIALQNKADFVQESFTDYYDAQAFMLARKVSQ